MSSIKVRTHKKGLSQKLFRKRTAQPFAMSFCKILRKTKEKASKRGENEYDKKRIVKILVFGVCIQLRRTVLRGVQWEQIESNSSFFLSVAEFFYV